MPSTHLRARWLRRFAAVTSLSCLACSGWGRYRAPSSAFTPTPASEPIRVTTHDRTSRMLYDVLVHSDSVIGTISTVLTPASFARQDVAEMRWANWAVDRSANIKLRDGSLHALRG